MQRYFSNKLIDKEFIITNNDLYHIKTVMRLKNESLIEIVFQNELYLAKLNNNKVILHEKKESKLDGNHHYTLCLPLLTDSKMSFILQKATELGINKIIPILTKRSIVKLDKKDISKKYERWYKICKEASEQSKRLDIPVISDIMALSELKITGLKLVCSTVHDNKLKDVLQNKNNNITFLVGPEGGLAEEELSLLFSLDFKPVSLGKNILRVETAPIYILSVLKYEE